LNHAEISEESLAEDHDAPSTPALAGDESGMKKGHGQFGTAHDLRNVQESIRQV